jgi:hypothetical protein
LDTVKTSPQGLSNYENKGERKDLGVPKGGKVHFQEAPNARETPSSVDSLKYDKDSKSDVLAKTEPMYDPKDFKCRRILLSYAGIWTPDLKSFYNTRYQIQCKPNNYPAILVTDVN